MNKNVTFYIFTVSILVTALGWNSVGAQTDTCSLVSTLTSYEAAAVSGGMETFLARFEQAKCSTETTISARMLILAYADLESVETGNLSNPCTRQAIIASFQAAALSKDTETWIHRYADSDCSEPVKNGTRIMSQIPLVSGTTDIALLIPHNWSNGTGQRLSDAQGYTGVTLTISQIQDSIFEGVFSFNGPPGLSRVRISGQYFSSVDVDPTAEPFNSIQMCRGEFINAWLRWEFVDMVEGSRPNFERLYVAAITENGNMCLVTLQTRKGGSVIAEWSLSTGPE